MQPSPEPCDRRGTHRENPPARTNRKRMAEHPDSDPKVSCPACEAPVSMRTGIVNLGACFALLCPHCGELSFPKPSTYSARRR